MLFLYFYSGFFKCYPPRMHHLHYLILFFFPPSERPLLIDMRWLLHIFLIASFLLKVFFQISRRTIVNILHRCGGELLEAMKLLPGPIKAKRISEMFTRMMNDQLVEHHRIEADIVLLDQAAFLHVFYGLEARQKAHAVVESQLEPCLFPTTASTTRSL